MNVMTVHAMRMLLVPIFLAPITAHALMGVKEMGSQTAQVGYYSLFPLRWNVFFL